MGGKPTQQLDTSEDPDPDKHVCDFFFSSLLRLLGSLTATITCVTTVNRKKTKKQSTQQ